MCMICNDWNASEQNLPAKRQGVRNLFETKEKIGAEHTQEVVDLLNINLDSLNDRLIQAIREFVGYTKPITISNSEVILCWFPIGSGPR
ncbi:MAG: hypothetical protein Q8P20_00670 [bacterium]|nr:hypothetical protein [bacterium]